MEQTTASNYVQNEIDSIKEQIIAQYAPEKIVLFGSQTKGTATKMSDIDLCIIKESF